jgi:hypothetical protein
MKLLRYAAIGISIGLLLELVTLGVEWAGVYLR